MQSGGAGRESELGLTAVEAALEEDLVRVLVCQVEVGRVEVVAGVKRRGEVSRCSADGVRELETGRRRDDVAFLEFQGQFFSSQRQIPITIEHRDLPVLAWSVPQPSPKRLRFPPLLVRALPSPHKHPRSKKQLRLTEF